MTKAEMIEKHGVEYYERLKEKSRAYQKAKYDANPEAERERKRQSYNADTHKRYNEQHKEIYRINMRDRNRLTLLRQMSLEGFEVHHLKYHSDNKDASWIDDIIIMTREEHRKWHSEHPDFKAEDNII